MDKGILFMEIEALLRQVKETCPEAKAVSLNDCKKDLTDEAIEARMAVDKQDWQELKVHKGKNN